MIKLSHSHYLPDEHIDPGSLLPTKPQSGLKTTSFVFNTLLKDGTDQEIAHAKGLGYIVNPLDLFVVGSPTPTFLMPFPLNRGIPEPADRFYWTWRDTSILEVAGPNGNGIPLLIEVDVGLATAAGSIASTSQVPTIGLPILMEHSCYPTVSGIGLNAFDVSLALNTSRLPAFRVFSTGGVNTSGQTITKDPDLELQPDGGFNPSSTPPGKTTPPDDPSFYIGQMDTITRISRVHSIWIQPFNAAVTRHEIEIRTLEERIGLAERIVRNVRALQSELEAVERSIKDTEIDLLTLLDRLATNAGLTKGQIESVTPRPSSPNPHYPETRVEVRLKGTTLKQTVDFLYRIETADLHLIVRSLRITTRGKEEQVLDVSFSVSSFERA